MGVEADDRFHEAGAVGFGVVCHGREEGLHLGDEGLDFGCGEGVGDFEGGHVQACWGHCPEGFAWSVSMRSLLLGYI